MYNRIKSVIYNLPIRTKYEYTTIYYLRNCYYKYLKSFIRKAKVYPNNFLYGHHYWLKRYANYEDIICGTIEHGLYFGENYNTTMSDFEFTLGSIITYGQYRYNVLRQHYPHHKIFQIGPRINYVDPDIGYYNNIKSDLLDGKVLTFFPEHSISGVYANYDIDATINKIRKLKHFLNCTNVLICCYFQDIYSGLDLKYRERGFATVTAGANQINFLPRLKAIIMASDYTASNGLGTNLGYCVFMHKPHILIADDINYLGSQEALYNEFLTRGNQWANKYEYEKHVFYDMFSMENGYTINDRQMKLCDFYWGFSQIKSPKELNAILMNCKDYVAEYRKHAINTY